MTKKSKLEKKIYRHLEERGWHNLRPSDLAKSVMIEGAELLELFQWDNPSLEEVKKDAARLAEIRKELADVLIYALDIAVLLDLSSEKIINEKLARIAKKYPAKLMRKNAVVGAGSGEDKTYWKIKKKYRKQGK
jgi:NTP pyrophosphatase (non-canonical NTP hydrolase)